MATKEKGNLTRQESDPCDVDDDDEKSREEEDIKLAVQMSLGSLESVHSESTDREGAHVYAVYIHNPTTLPSAVYLSQMKRSIIGYLTHSQVGSGKLEWAERGWRSESDFSREFQGGLEKFKIGLCARKQTKEEAEKLVEALLRNQIKATCEKNEYPKTLFVDQTNIPKRQGKYFSKEMESVDKDVAIAPGGRKIYAVGIEVKTSERLTEIFDKDGLDFLESKTKTFFDVMKKPDHKFPERWSDRIKRHGVSWNENGWVGGQMHFSLCANAMVKEHRQFLLAYNITQRRAHVIQARLMKRKITGVEVLKRGERKGMSHLLDSPILIHSRRKLDDLLDEMERNRRSFRTGDVVKLSGDEILVRSLQIGHGGWTDSFKHILGKEGEVVRVDGDGDVHVNFPVLSRTLCVAPQLLTTTKTGDIRTNSKQKPSLGDIVSNLRSKDKSSEALSSEAIEKKVRGITGMIQSTKQFHPEFGGAHTLPQKGTRPKARRLIVDMSQIFSMSLPAAIVAGPFHQHRSWKSSMEIVDLLKNAGWENLREAFERMRDERKGDDRESLESLCFTADRNEQAVIRHVYMTVHEMEIAGRRFNSLLRQRSMIENTSWPDKFARHFLVKDRKNVDWEKLRSVAKQQEKHGWEVEEAMDLMMQGERDIVKLTSNVDAASGYIIEYILQRVRDGVDGVDGESDFTQKRMSKEQMMQFQERYEAEKNKKHAWPRCKITVVGNGRVGKTSLVRSLGGESHKSDQKSTIGAAIRTMMPGIPLRRTPSGHRIRDHSWTEFNVKTEDLVKVHLAKIVCRKWLQDMKIKEKHRHEWINSTTDMYRRDFYRKLIRALDLLKLYSSLDEQIEILDDLCKILMNITNNPRIRNMRNFDKQSSLSKKAISIQGYTFLLDALGFELVHEKGAERDDMIKDMNDAACWYAGSSTEHIRIAFEALKEERQFLRNKKTAREKSLKAETKQWIIEGENKERIRFSVSASTRVCDIIESIQAMVQPQGTPVTSLRITGGKRVDLMSQSKEVTVAKLGIFTSRKKIKVKLPLGACLQKITPPSPPPDIDSTATKDREQTCLGDGASKREEDEMVNRFRSPDDDEADDEHRILTFDAKDNDVISIVMQNVSDDDIEFTIWDLGGQETFHAVHSVFFSTGIYVVVFNIARVYEELTTKNEELTKKDGPELQSLLVWLDTIKTRAQNSPFMLVGTHDDELKKDCDGPDDLENKYDEVQEWIEEKVGLQNLIENSEQGLYFFPVDNTKSDGKGTEDETIARVRREVQVAAKGLEFIKEELTLAWMRAAFAILKSKKDYMTLKDVETICEAKGVRGDERSDDYVESNITKISYTFLQFLHRRGIIALFGTQDDAFIVIRPTWLLEKISSLIRVRNISTSRLDDDDYNCDTKRLSVPKSRLPKLRQRETVTHDHDTVASRELQARRGKYRKHWRNLRRTAIISSTYLKFLTELENEDEAIAYDFFVKQMERFNLMCPLRGQKHSNETSFLLPSLMKQLKDPTKKELSTHALPRPGGKHNVTAEKANTIVFDFSKNHLPIGFFEQLICYCISLSENSDKTFKLYANVADLCIKGNYFRLLLDEPGARIICRVAPLSNPISVRIYICSKVIILMRGIVKLMDNSWPQILLSPRRTDDGQDNLATTLMVEDHRLREALRAEKPFIPLTITNAGGIKSRKIPIDRYNFWFDECNPDNLPDLTALTATKSSDICDETSTSGEASAATKSPDICDETPPAKKFHFFISHKQQNASEHARVFDLSLSSADFGLDHKYKCWLDENEEPNLEGMIKGVKTSAALLLILTDGVLERPYCRFEIRMALAWNVPIITVKEGDRGKTCFVTHDELEAQCPEDLHKPVLLDCVYDTYQRNSYYVKAMLKKLEDTWKRKVSKAAERKFSRKDAMAKQKEAEALLKKELALQKRKEKNTSSKSSDHSRDTGGLVCKDSDVHDEDLKSSPGTRNSSTPRFSSLPWNARFLAHRQLTEYKILLKKKEESLKGNQETPKGDLLQEEINFLREEIDELTADYVALKELWKVYRGQWKLEKTDDETKDSAAKNINNGKAPVAGQDARRDPFRNI